MLAAFQALYHGPGREAMLSEIVRAVETTLRREAIPAHGQMCEFIAKRGGAEARATLLRIATDCPRPETRAWAHWPGSRRTARPS